MQEQNLEIIERLKNYYKNTKTALDFSTPFELLVATILSSQCTDERVNKITPNLFKKYRNVRGFAKAEQLELEEEIKSCGFFRNKTKSIIESSKRILEIYDGKVPEKMEDLITLRGVARKTANIILSSCFGKAEGIAVDTHVIRLSHRFLFSASQNPDKIEKDLMNFIPKKDWLITNYMLVNHGRKFCRAINPKCEICFLKDICPYFNRAKRPKITLKFAQSLDGKIAAQTGDSKWLSNPKMLEFAHELRAKNDAILVGINTILKDDSLLTVRRVKGQNPIRLILDSNLKISLESQIIKTANKIKTIIFISNKTKISDEKQKFLDKKNIKTVKIKNVDENLGLDLGEILEHVEKIGVKTLLVEGGSKVITNFIKNDLFDRIYIVFSPILIGNDGIPAIQNLGIKTIKNAKKLELKSLKQIENNFILELSQK